MFLSELFERLIRRALDPFLDGLDGLSLSPGLRSGKLEIRDVRLKGSLLSQVDPVGFGGLAILPASSVKLIRIELPWWQILGFFSILGTFSQTWCQKP